MENTKSNISILEFFRSFFGQGLTENNDKAILGEDLVKSLDQIEQKGNELEKKQSDDNKIVNSTTRQGRSGKTTSSKSIVHNQSHDKIHDDGREV